MARVIEVIDGKTLLVERDGTRERVRLAGIDVVNDVHAKALLEWTLANSWVMLEARGEAFDVYRSPDALFVNRELVQRGFARATRADINPKPTAMVTYLGVVQPMDSQKADTKSSEPKKASAPTSKTSSGTRRRSSASRSPAAKPSS